ncbi:hypothetical protein DdX_09931 [Ditylenchus destructor]|uniref:Uncharacterized protein n=1 Tax=Ditylenchus destructor TaxID=166010 RepID=A0AAD4MYY2_9BILA|nr:hypothetical protein DdX_09931 [Ditylenchus destructor]
MDFLAKHFFDYQSFVNLPHKAVQLHKTPPSQAGVDPTASWAPKSMHVAGKNQAAPQARSNRNHVEARPGSHRHGRPSKLEFRAWGERHGELKIEKIVPHKDAWMAALDGDFKHFYEGGDAEDGDNYAEAVCDVITGKNAAERLLSTDNIQLLTILTLTGHLEFVTLTVKALRGIGHHQEPYVRIQLFDGAQRIDERRSSRASLEARDSPTHIYGIRHNRGNTPPTPKRTDVVSSPSVLPKHGVRGAFRISQNHRSIHFRPSGAMAHLRNRGASPSHPTFHHNGGPLSAHPKEMSPTTASRSASPKERRQSILSRRSSLDSIVSATAERESPITDLSESFLLRIQPGRLAQCHILLQVYVCHNPSSELTRKEENSQDSHSPSHVSILRSNSSQQGDTLVGGCVIGPLSPDNNVPVTTSTNSNAPAVSLAYIRDRKTDSPKKAETPPIVQKTTIQSAC